MRAIARFRNERLIQVNDIEREMASHRPNAAAEIDQGAQSLDFNQELASLTPAGHVTRRGAAMPVNDAPGGVLVCLAAKERPAVEFPGRGLVAVCRQLDRCIVASHHAGVQLVHGGPGHGQQAVQIGRHRGGQLGHQVVPFVALC